MAIITIDNLSAGYGKLVVLHELSLQLNSGKFTVILGPNGSGKSTLLKSVFALTQIFGGSIRIGERELVGLPTESITGQGISYIPQRSNIFTAMTVRENLLLGVRKLNKTAAAHALNEAYELFPILTKRQSQRAGQLSGGERQMVAIAVGWLLRPRVMLLDEPSAGLSPLFTTEVFRVLKQLCANGMTIGVVEQNARSALKWADYVYVLREGQLAFEGTAEATSADEDTLKNYLGVGKSKIDV